MNALFIVYIVGAVCVVARAATAKRRVIGVPRAVLVIVGLALLWPVLVALAVIISAYWLLAGDL